MSEVNTPESDSSGEKALAAAWCAVLNVPTVRPDDRFFDLGGDSIGVLKLIAKLRESGFGLSLQELYENPGFGAAAALVTPIAEVAHDSRGVRRLPLLPVQIRTLQYDRIDPSFHNDNAVYAVPDGITAEHLVDALGVLVAHHPTLGTRFCLTPGEEFQEVGHDVDVAAVTEVLEVEPGDADLVKEIGVKAHRSLDLETGRVLAVRILTRQGEPWALALVTHHLVSDLMGWNVLAFDLARLLEARLTGTAADLPAATAYATWVDFLTEQAAGPAYREHLAYWRSRPWQDVTGLPRLTDDPDRRLGGLRNTRSSVDLGDAQAFRRAAAAIGGDAVVVGALNYAMRHVHQASTTLIDVVVNGRDQIRGAPDISRTVGYLAEFAPVVTELGDATSAGEVIRATAGQFHAAPAPRISFGALRHLTPDRSVRDEFQGLPAADIYVNYRGSLRSDDDSPLPELDYSLGPFQSPDEQQGYPLRIMVDLDGAAMTSVWKFSATELDEADVDAMIAAFNRALRELTLDEGAFTEAGAGI